MIELFLNEKSLDGQFATIDEFSEQGVVGLIAVLEDQKRLSEPSVLYKSESLTEAKVTPTTTYTEVVFGPESRIHDGIRRYKTHLITLLDNPYWTSDSKQNPTDTYTDIDGKTLNGTTIAEAETRDGILVSFAHPDYMTENLEIKKNDEKVSVHNVWKEIQLIDATYKKAIIKFKEYVELRFQGQKLDFSKATMAKVWDVIPADVETFLYDAFETFCQKSWVEIPRDKGLGYKPYNKSRMNSHYFTADEWKKGIMEFRFSGKYRCFGYVDGPKFYLLMVDFGHIIGDK